MNFYRTPSGAPSGQRDLSGKATSAGPMPAIVPANMDTSTILSEDGGKACEGCLGKPTKKADKVLSHVCSHSGIALVLMGPDTGELSGVQHLYDLLEKIWRAQVTYQMG